MHTPAPTDTPLPTPKPELEEAQPVPLRRPSGLFLKKERDTLQGNAMHTPTRRTAPSISPPTVFEAFPSGADIEAIPQDPAAPTVVLIAPQGAGKSTYAAAFALALGCTHVIDEQDLNGFDVEDPKAIPRKGALIITQAGAIPEITDLVIEARTTEGFDKAVSLLP